MLSTDEVAKITNALQETTLQKALQYIDRHFPNRAVFTTSFGYEDQVITHFIFTTQLRIRVATLDTGRLFPETYLVYNRTVEKYNQPIPAFFPAASEVEALLSEKGPLSFYQSIENRKQCCDIRKVKPLARALSGSDIWITGIRAEHSPTRNNLTTTEWDDNHRLLKVHPLLQYKSQEVIQYIKENDVPYNILHDKGFSSIGCQPCTRAIQPGEDIRAGRWWWEENSGKECGLHVK